LPRLTKILTIHTFFTTLFILLRHAFHSWSLHPFKNADQHPGLAVKKNTRRSSKEVAAERQAKEDAKLEKARTKAAGIKCVAEYEMAQASKDAADATPRAAPQAKPLARTRSYADVLKGVNDEMSDIENE